MIDREDLSAHEKLIYSILARYANDDDEAFPSYNTLAKKSSLSKSTVIRVVKSLEDKGLLEKQLRKKSNIMNTSNLYILMSTEQKDIDYQSINDEVNPSITDTPPSITQTLLSVTDTPPPSVSVTPPSVPVTPKKDLLKNTNIIKKTNIKTDLEFLRKRYTQEQVDIVDNFMKILSYTRKYEKIAENVILKIYQSWDKYRADVVIYALSVYIDNPKHHDKRENYVLGIMRNTTAEQVAEYNSKKNKSSAKVTTVKPNTNNRFHNFKQQYTDLESDAFEGFFANGKRKTS